MRNIFNLLFKVWPAKYYNFWFNFINFKSKVRLFDIDFKKNWANIIFHYKYSLVFVMLISILLNIFSTLLPMIIGLIIEQRDYFYLLLFILIWLFFIFTEFISYYYAWLIEIQCINSIHYNAFKSFLLVDPVYHTKKESGKIFAKIERAARAYEDFLDIIFWDLIPTIISVITVVSSFFFINFKLGLICLLLLLFISTLNVFLVLFYNRAFEKNVINADDKVKVISVESLTQVQLIRSYFDSDYIVDKAKSAIWEIMYITLGAWTTIGIIIAITRFLYLCSIGFIIYNIFIFISKDIISSTIGITLILTYLRGTTDVIKIGRKISKMLKSITRIIDLFNYINNFGKQSFPILEADLLERHIAESNIDIKVINAKKLNYIKLELQNLYFDYNAKATIFEDHNLFLDIDKAQRNKLYGIIGPSGIGKTTLISILGGQLKPTKGQVLLNDISIYDIADYNRKSLLAIQAQVSSGLSGTLKHNLLLGLPDDVYKEDYIINILKEVGIWEIFEEKEGLETPVGEGGLTLSGGQRQRLNFASLYLRAQYYKPLLILIDEPTSSLDEISEFAITNMINKLAQDSLTLVIAHRLRTLKDAIAILDFSLIQEKDIKFYNDDQLKYKSLYFKKLLEGHVDIEV